MSRRERRIQRRFGVVPKVGSRSAVLCRASLILTRTVLSSQLDFDAKGDQAVRFADDPPRAAVDGILIGKMRGGQVREATLL